MNIDNHRTYSSAFTLWKYRGRSKLSIAEQKIFRQYFSSLQHTVLDIGVGAGRTAYFFSQSRRYTAIDYSSRMIDYCRAVFGDFEGNRFLKGDCRELNFLDESFDRIVFSFNGIDYIGYEDRLKALTEVFRVLKKGGVYYFSTHHTKSLQRSWREIIRSPHFLEEALRKVQLRLFNPNADFSDFCMRPQVIVRDMATLVTCYISLEKQLEDLESIGFKNIRFLDEAGNPISENIDYREKWFHVVCNR